MLWLISKGNDNVLQIYSIQQNEIHLNLIFYNLQTIPNITLFICVYIIALSITKLCSLSVFMDYVPNEVLYGLTRALREKVAFINQSIKNLDPHTYH